jgi:hypothetical protein
MRGGAQSPSYGEEGSGAGGGERGLQCGVCEREEGREKSVLEMVLLGSLEEFADAPKEASSIFDNQSIGRGELRVSV